VVRRYLDEGLPVLKRFSIKDNFARFYGANGYVVLTDLFSAADLKAVRKEILALYKRRFPRVSAQASRAAVLSPAYESQKTAWRDCARHIWDVMSISRLAAHEQLPRVLRRAGLEHPIVSTRPEPRIDMSGDVLYMQPWHQDWRYAQTSVNAITMWTPLHDVSRRDGAIEVIPGSHRWGILESRMLEQPRRFELVDDRLQDARPELADLRLGETILFSQLLVHRSGHNTSGSPRLTVQFRYADFADPYWRDNGYCTPATSDLAWRTLPSTRSINRLFRA
jgi:ectoine hydroxylase-related dioxygenase (phytanoyl-CoA dioxygenase family)